jgi:NCS1 family nucleobase:cation symporter-1
MNPSAVPGGAATGTDAVLAIERHGIDLVGDRERHGRARELFGMWAGTNLNIFYVVNGALIISFGLSFAQSLLAILLGNLAFLAVGLTSLQGPRTGTSTFAVSRAAYGPNGGRGLSLFNWITTVGFEASGLALIVLAALALLEKAGVQDSAPEKAIVILVAAVVQALLPVWGHATIVAAQRKLAWIFGVLFVVVAAVVAHKVHLGALSQGGHWETITIAIALVVSGGGFSWANTGSDYSRYLPRDTSPAAICWWSSLGGMLPAVLLEILGAAVASVTQSADDPIAGIPQALPNWLSVPYLIFAVLTLLAVNTMNLYSSGLNLQVIGVRLGRWKCVIVDSVVCTVLCFLAIFNSSFNKYYGEFLALLIIWLAPWIAIYGVDWLLRRGRYDARALLDESPSGRYWRSGGFFLPGVVAQLAGMAAAGVWINSSAFVGPLSTAAYGSDFSVFTGFLVGGLVYWALARPAVRRETAQTVAPRPAAVPAAGMPELAVEG